MSPDWQSLPGEVALALRKILFKDGDIVELAEQAEDAVED
jgi:hypothetical protein